jgi:transitional endoplasmic reticulum ATPase
VVVLAATNRIDMVDPALLRAGRFDKLVHIPVPDRNSRLAVLEIHAKNKPFVNVSLEKIADLTDGFSGADLAAVTNTAVSLVLQDFLNKYRKPEDAKTHSNEAIVKMEHIEEAVKKVKNSREGKTLEKAPVPYYK